MQSKAKTVDEYLAELSEERREALSALRAVILKNLPHGYEEGMQYGMIGYFVPHSVYPSGYHCDPKQPLPFAGLASQKNHMSLYLMCIYGDPAIYDWFRQAWTKSGKRLDMGKGCVRFKRIDDVPLKVVGDAIKRVPVKKLIAFYESAVPTAGNRKKAASGKKTSAGKKTSVGKKTSAGKKRAVGEKETAGKK